MAKKTDAPFWREIPLGGSAEAEEALFVRFAEDMVNIQRHVAHKSGLQGQRTLHAKMIAGFADARLVVDTDLPNELAQGSFQPGSGLSAQVRFSNASSFHRPDAIPDMRGIAVRLDLGAGQSHDLLATSYPVSHARDAAQFVEVAKIANGPRVLILPRFLSAFGIKETLRILGNVRAGSRTINSIATQSFWSRGAILWGSAGPVRFSFQPTSAPGPMSEPGDLGKELEGRLAKGDVAFRLKLQKFLDESCTPIEDGSVEWQEKDTPSIGVATLIIPHRDTDAPDAGQSAGDVNALAFNPWNAPSSFRPLGNLNRARGQVYAASAKQWGGHR